MIYLQKNSVSGSMISEAVKAQLLQGDAVNALRAAKEAQQLGFGWKLEEKWWNQNWLVVNGWLMDG